MPHGSTAYQERWVLLPALRHCTAYGRHEEKAVRSLRIDRVTEKNQKNEKLLTDKKGRILLANLNQCYFNSLAKTPCHKMPYRS